MPHTTQTVIRLLRNAAALTTAVSGGALAATAYQQQPTQMSRNLAKKAQADLTSAADIVCKGLANYPKVAETTVAQLADDLNLSMYGATFYNHGKQKGIPPKQVRPYAGSPSTTSCYVLGHDAEGKLFTIFVVSQRTALATDAQGVKRSAATAPEGYTDPPLLPPATTPPYPDPDLISEESKANIDEAFHLKLTHHISFVEALQQVQAKTAQQNDTPWRHSDNVKSLTEAALAEFTSETGLPLSVVTQIKKVGPCSDALIGKGSALAIHQDFVCWVEGKALPPTLKTHDPLEIIRVDRVRIEDIQFETNQDGSTGAFYICPTNQEKILLTKYCTTNLSKVLEDQTGYSLENYNKPVWRRLLGR